MNTETGLYLLAGLAGGSFLLLGILVIILFVLVSKLRKEIIKSEDPPYTQHHSDGRRHPSTFVGVRGEQDELAKKGYSVYAPPVEHHHQMHRRPEQQVGAERRVGPPPPPTPKKPGGFSYGGMPGKIIKSDTFGEMAAGEVDVSGGMGMAGGMIGNEDVGGVLQNEHFQTATNMGLEFGASRAQKYHERSRQQHFSRTNSANFY